MLSRALIRSGRSSAPLLRFPHTASASPWRGIAVPPALAMWTRGMARESGSRPPRFSSPQNSSQPSASHRQPQASSPGYASSRPSPPPNPTIPPHRPEAADATYSAKGTQSRSPGQESAATGRPQYGAEPASESDPAPEVQIPISSLPDLTQGIPSTLEYETTGATSRSALATVDASGGGRGKGELPASAYVSSSERRRQKLANWLFGITIGMTVGGTVYAGRNWNEEDERRHPDVPNGWGMGLWWNRAMTRTKEVLTYYHEPAFEKLLPDPDPTFERPYTLCISLEDMLVHSEWSREHGWRVAKRPGADYFLHYLSQYYELVLFTTVPVAMGEPLIRKLDPYRFIVYPLFREATKYKDGEIVKDLSYLNRDLSKVIILDTSNAHVRAQPENAIILPKWTGDPKDMDLVALIPFLEYVFTMQYGDVRKILKSFDGKDIPTEFARREGIARAEFQKQLEAQKKKHPFQGKTGISGLGSMLGLKPSNMSLMVSPEGEPNPSEEFAKGKMLQDIARERGQRGYEMMEKAIRENGEAWLKEEAALQEKAQQEAMDSMKSSFTGWFTPPKNASGKPPPADVEEKKP